MPDNTINDIILELKSKANPETVKGMARYGIDTSKALGITIVDLRKLAKSIPKNHNIALDLWKTDILEARFLASMIDKPEEVTEKQMEEWVLDFNSWDICDQTCNNLFKKTSFAHSKAIEWATREEEFVKRAGFTLMATLAVGDKKAENTCFEKFFPYIINESTDKRNFVKKAVNWALRQIGKRNLYLNKEAVKVAEEILNTGNKDSKWVASNALTELKSEAVLIRLRNK